MYYAFVVETTDQRFYAVKVLTDTLPEAQKRARAAYPKVAKLHEVGDAPNDNADKSLKLYEKAIEAAAKLERRNLTAATLF